MGIYFSLGDSWQRVLAELLANHVSLEWYPPASTDMLATLQQEAIRVRQVRHSHRYIFTVQKLRGRRLLWAGPIFGNRKASVPAMMLLGAARTFAEHEARKAGLID